MHVFSKEVIFGVICTFLGAKVHVLHFRGNFALFWIWLELKNKVKIALKRFYRRLQHILAKNGVIARFWLASDFVVMKFPFLRAKITIFGKIAVKLEIFQDVQKLVENHLKLRKRCGDFEKKKNIQV